MDDRFKKTIEGMKNNDPLIYQGVLKFDNLLGIPDLLQRMPDGLYVPIEIKSGMARQGVDDQAGKEGILKKHYAIQLCLYVEILKKMGFESNNMGFVLDIQGEKVKYDLDQPMGKRNKLTFWEYYEIIKKNVDILLNNQDHNNPAMAGVCKLCPWHDSCKSWVEENDDLTGLYYVGRSKRDVIHEDLQINSIEDILKLDINEAIEQKRKDKTFLKGIGQKTIEKIVARANILKNTKQPIIYNKIEFPKVSYELFFDIEDDPTQEFVYLHGIYEYRKLQKIYPEVISEEELEIFFSNPNVIDLYTDIVSKNTDWPVGSYSLKALAQYLGFKWRDETPSGALSIQWFNEYLENKDEKVLDRILKYNEDDCKATMVLKDGIQSLAEKC